MARASKVFGLARVFEETVGMNTGFNSFNYPVVLVETHEKFWRNSVSKFMKVSKWPGKIATQNSAQLQKAFNYYPLRKVRCSQVQQVGLSKRGSGF